MLIGISGKIGAGKDTFANELKKIIPTLTIHKYADKLKQVAALITGYEDQYSQEGKNVFMPEWNMTVGEFQQKLGTDAVRNGINQDAWIIALFAEYDKPKYVAINRCADSPTKQVKRDWVITDVRFPNEAEAILRRNGILVRIDGTRLTDSKRNLNHISETALDDWPHWNHRFDNSTLLPTELREHARIVALKAEMFDMAFDK